MFEAARLEKQMASQRGSYDKGDIDYMAGNVYFHKGQFALARGYFQEYLSDLHYGTLSLLVTRDVYEMLFVIDSTAGNYISAISQLKRLRSLLDSNFSIQRRRQSEELQVRYETEKKDNDIKILKQQDQISQAQLTQTRLNNNIIIAGVVLLTLLLALLYARYRTNQRHNRQLETKQREINEKNIALEHLITDKDILIADKDVLLKEKDWLVKEIHHRVKNNLQMIISLLNAQSEFLNNPSAINAIRESRERMRAIAILHQNLYQQENNTIINMRIYINELVDNIQSSFSDTSLIYFKLDVADVSLDISQSMPIGLILNEAITNAIKYAYSKNERGGIHILLQYTDLHQLQLKISDHGRGLPAGINMEQTNSLGLQLIKLFAEQLDGELLFINNNGLEVIINFKTAEYANASAEKGETVSVKSNV
jgi:two-component sensor histidine kinase